MERAQRELELKQQLFEQQCVVNEAALVESVWQQAVNEDTTLIPLQSSTRGTVNHDICDWDRAIRETVFRPEATVITEAKVRPEV